MMLGEVDHAKTYPIKGTVDKVLHSKIARSRHTLATDV